MNAENQQKEYEKLISSFKADCVKWGWCESDTSSTEVGSAIFNRDLDVNNFSEIRYIVVADNPGTRERDNAKYLFDDGNDKRRSGYIARRIFEKIFDSKPYLVLNKTPLFTPKTSDLDEIKYPNLSETMKRMAELIYKINLLNKSIQVFVFGFGDSFDSEKGVFCKSGLWNPFFEKLLELYKSSGCALNFPVIAKHFSRYSIFQDFVIEDGMIHGARKMKLMDLKEDNAAAFRKELESLPYKDWLNK